MPSRTFQLLGAPQSMAVLSLPVDPGASELAFGVREVVLGWTKTKLSNSRSTSQRCRVLQNHSTNLSNVLHL